jgi:hypothetical protein
VAAPNTSAHVSGDAVDIGPFDATAWLSELYADLRTSAYRAPVWVLLTWMSGTGKSALVRELRRRGYALRP